MCTRIQEMNGMCGHWTRTRQEYNDNCGIDKETKLVYFGNRFCKNCRGRNIGEDIGKLQVQEGQGLKRLSVWWCRWVTCLGVLLKTWLGVEKVLNDEWANSCPSTGYAQRDHFQTWWKVAYCSRDFSDIAGIRMNDSCGSWSCFISSRSRRVFGHDRAPNILSWSSSNWVDFCSEGD